jgi:hypothetical protein
MKEYTGFEINAYDEDATPSFDTFSDSSNTHNTTSQQ